MFVYDSLMDIREWVEEINDEDEFIFYDGLDAAFVGLSVIYVAAEGGGFYQQPVTVYDWDLIVEVLLDSGVETVEEADEYISFNIANAYLGPSTPLVIKRPPWMDLSTIT